MRKLAGLVLSAIVAFGLEVRGTYICVPTEVHVGDKVVKRYSKEEQQKLVVPVIFQDNLVGLKFSKGTVVMTQTEIFSDKNNSVYVSSDFDTLFVTKKALEKGYLFYKKGNSQGVVTLHCKKIK